ncbi:response regulator transcription factor [Psychroserpens luteus]|uniref:Response regulator n=1 Tax=Psychroserpens luteus TaxID=1434066 RepID=A0ABW6A1R2_9FLAO|nr:response regulator transcription factor [Psychroserpens luteus]
MKTHSVVIVDDHTLVSQAIGSLVNSFRDFKTQYICNSGKELIEKLKLEKAKPRLILMDISMPHMNGIETTLYVKEMYPDIKVIALTAIENNDSIIKMLKAGAKGYVLKGADIPIFENTLKRVIQNGSYYNEKITNIIINSIINEDEKQENIQLKKQEEEFIRYACSELTYKEIANRMYRSPKTIDGYRNDLFEKLNIRNRTGLVLYAIKNKIFNIQ